MTAIKQYILHDGENVPYIRGSKGCFAAGTMITMADESLKPIEEIQKGDLVTTFDKLGNLGPASVFDIFKHENDEFIKIKHWKGELIVTPNHWLLMEDGLFLEAAKFQEKEDQLVTYEGKVSPIDEISPAPVGTSYNFSVSQQHTYIANNIRVHNKGGGGKGGGGGGGAVEDPNTLFSTDSLFVTNGFGEGPMYRINPNGPQDIEIQDGNIDDLINLDGDGLEDTNLFKTISNPGTVTQGALDVFGEEIATPQNFTQPVTLKKGNVNGIPESKIELQNTSAPAAGEAGGGGIDALRFAFEIASLINQDDQGNIRGSSVSISIQIFNRTGNKEIIPVINREISGKTNTPFRFDVTALIPIEERSDEGYKFTILKTSDDSDSSKILDEITVKGWVEIEFKKQAYPRTAHIGYAIKAHSEHVGGVPNFTSLVKGLLVKVPSNYNQPILQNGEIDWRELEVVDDASGTDTNSYQNAGYSLQNTGPDVKLSGGSSDRPEIYVGTWDGTFVYSWTQNPVWILYDLLTNTTYGLAIQEEVIDKFKFYQVAQYCDACNELDGRFDGLIALSDGSFRHKPRGQFTSIRENQFGLSNTLQIIERRFTLDITISDQGQALDILNQIASTFRGVLVYSTGQLTLAVDLPDELPVAMFNEANIKDGSFQLSGIKESEIITAVDVSYIEPTNHYIRETVRIDSIDRNDGREKSELENLSTLDLIGVTRRSQALRFAHYQLAASQYLRRKVEFTTSIEAINLTPGDVISVSQQQIGIAFGYGGRITANSLIAQSNAAGKEVYLEYFTAPTLPSTFFTANSKPLALRIFRQISDRVDLYLISNTTYELITTKDSVQATSNTYITSNANVNFGIDLANITVLSQFNTVTKDFAASFSGFAANSAPVKGDLWMLGEINTPDDIYTNKAGKLFKITTVNRTEDQEIQISAMEYVPNVYVDSDEFIDFTPTGYTDTISPFVRPPIPEFDIRQLRRRTGDGSVVVDLLINPFTERLNYPLKFSTEYQVALPDTLALLSNITANSNGTLSPSSFRLGNANVITNEAIDKGVFGSAASVLRTSLDPTFQQGGDKFPVIVTGKNGFRGRTGALKLLCNTVSKIDTTVGDTVGNIAFTVEGLNVAYDYNFAKHVLNVNDAATFLGLKGSDYVSFPVNEYSNTGGVNFDFVGFNPRVTQYTSNIILFNSNSAQELTDGSFILSNNQIKIKNAVGDDGSTELFSTIPSAPFLVELAQLLDARFYSNNNFYVAGSEFDHIQSNTITLVDSTHTEPLLIEPRAIEFVSVFVDGIQLSTAFYTLDTTSYPSILSVMNQPASASQLKVVVNHYTVPSIEIGDNVQFTSGNTFSVIATSYDSDALNTGNTFQYNAAMTQNNIFTITTDGTPKANIGGLQAVNISPDIVTSLANTNYDTLANVSTPISRFTLDYNKTVYPGNLRLANNGIYNLAFGSGYESVLLPSADRTIPNVPLGPISIRARNRNFAGRLSEFTTKTVNVTTVPIQRVENLEITESLYIDTVVGVSVRGTITFDAILRQEVTDYEISYRLSGSATDLTTFNTVKVAATGVDDDGKIRFTVNQLDRGNTTGINTIIAKVTPLNRDIRGVSTELSQLIIGKTAPPQNIFDFTAGQSDQQITLFWQYLKTNEILDDLDLSEVIIRRQPGEVSNTIANFNTAVPLVIVSAPTSRKSTPIDDYGEFTYLARTVDTSGNFSEDVQSFTFTTFEPTTATPIAAYNEDSPSVNFTNITNTNAGEDNYPSFNTSNAGGLTFEDKTDGFPSSLVDNANGSSSGYSATGDADDLSVTGAEATYYTQIRDLGMSRAYLTTVDFSGSQTVKTTYNDLRATIVSDVSETSAPFDNVLKATGIGTLLGTTWSAFYDANNKTLIDNSTAGATAGTSAENVFAIWNDGQFVNDTSNANSYALVAGVIDADSIELGAAYFANGDPTGANTFANITADAGNTFLVVDLQDYRDDTSLTFDGGAVDITSQTFLRTSTEANVWLMNAALSNGNVNVVQFTGSSVNDGFQIFDAGEKTFKYMQLKLIINNANPEQTDFTLDKIRYIIRKRTETFSSSFVYNSSPTAVNYTSANFLQIPSVTLGVTDAGNAVLTVLTDFSNTGANVKVFNADGSAKAADGSATVSLTATGV